jgi:hypothetical protein
LQPPSKSSKKNPSKSSKQNPPAKLSEQIAPIPEGKTYKRVRKEYKPEVHDMVIPMSPAMQDEYDMGRLEQINSLCWGRRKSEVITDAAKAVEEGHEHDSAPVFGSEVITDAAKAVAQWEEGHEHEIAPVFGKQPQDQSSFMSMRTWPLVFGKQPQDQSLLRM